jgi:hypothetical protein
MYKIWLVKTCSITCLWDVAEIEEVEITLVKS